MNESVEGKAAQARVEMERRRGGGHSNSRQRVRGSSSENPGAFSRTSNREIRRERQRSGLGDLRKGPRTKTALREEVREKIIRKATSSSS